MNKRTRKLKKNTQRGGFIVSPTNPYFMAVAAVIGGLYAYGRNQNSNTEPTPAPDNNQAGGRTFRRTRKRRGGMDDPPSGSRKRKAPTKFNKKYDYIMSLTNADFNNRRFGNIKPPFASLYRSIAGVKNLDEFITKERDIQDHYINWRASEAKQRSDNRAKSPDDKVKSNFKATAKGTAAAAAAAVEAMLRADNEDAEIEREIDEEAAVEFERETFDMKDIPNTPVGVKYGDVGSVKRPNSGFTPDKPKGTGLDLDSDGLDGLGLDFGLEVDNPSRGELFPGKGNRGGKRINKTRRRKANKKKRTRRR
jgi:hypothetical protein